NQYACAHLKQPKHPATGEISTLINISSNQIIHQLDKSVRKQAVQTAQSSIGWRNQHTCAHLKRPKHPMTGEIRTLERG
ncbi:hypothetical protein, partial [uncultured Bifidobacterium sp.]|uniref:hypothetical protein n=1 Tax=uncultured Bifidobacterium sp. TaxID=165187 RepID=UPI002638E9E4